MEFFQKLRRMSLVVGVVVLLDQGSKYLAVRLLEDRSIVSLYNDCLRFLLVENHGGFLSFGASLADPLRGVLFLVLTSALLAFFSMYTLVEKKSSHTVFFASSMIIGGGMGNLLDRAFRDGAVIDFANVGIGGLRTGIFNVADMAVLFGCMVLFFGVFFAREKKKKG
jgi:signal peptidase II